MPQGVRVVRAVALLSAASVLAAVVGVVTTHTSGAPSAGSASRRTATAAVAGTQLPLSVGGSAATPAVPSFAGPGSQLSPVGATSARSARSAHGATGNAGSAGKTTGHPTITEHVNGRNVTFVHSCAQNVPPGQVACYAERRTDPAATSTEVTGPGAVAGVSTAVTPSGALIALPRGLGPQQLQAAYGLPSATAGNGQTVFIIDAYDDPSAESDLAVYRSTYGLPPCTSANLCFSKLNQNGQTGPLPGADTTGWSDEISLDLDMVSAICPNCHITLLEAVSGADTSVFTAVATANRLGAKFVSMSWGDAELPATTQAKLDSTYFAATGVVYTAASGDKGYGDGVIYPATSNRVVAVGGTSLTPASTTSRGWTESAWSGAGSGCSAVEPAATWQLHATPCSRRATTDVSAVADPDTGVAVYQTYRGHSANGWAVYGGTSAATPIIASVYALAGTPAPAINPAELLYQHPHSLYDITSGSNGSCSPSSLCHGTAGWDGPTGLGTPHGLAAFEPARSSHTTAPGSTLGPGWPPSTAPHGLP